jgi:hypothetical protein
MAKLDLYSGRTPHEIDVDINGEAKSFKIPSDYTVEETERILEIEDRISKEVDKNRSL